MKTIMISDETYKKLASMKGKRSFTQLLSDMADHTRTAKLEDIDQFFGVMGKDEAERLQKSVAKHRRQFRVYRNATLS